MIRGKINAAREAVIRLELRGPTGQTAVVDTVIDTGYSGFLTVTPEIASRLMLKWHSGRYGSMADGSIREFMVYIAEVYWNDGWRETEVLALGNEVLLGMRMLQGYKLTVEVVPDGGIEISPLL